MENRCKLYNVVHMTANRVCFVESLLGKKLGKILQGELRTENEFTAPSIPGSAVNSVLPVSRCQLRFQRILQHL